VSGNDEFAELADTFNGLLGRLDASFQEQKRALELQRRFTADASHELKTPLTIVKGNTSLALSRASIDDNSRHTLTEIDRAADTMSQLVQDLLLLARSDSGQLGGHRIEMLLREILETAASQATPNGGPPVRLKVEPEDLCVMGNEAELVRVFRNLLDNALCHTPSDGCISVSAHSSDGAVLVTVEDTGTGIAPEHLSHLGERFYRVDAARSRPTGGTGLGLSICKSILKAHAGGMEIESAVGKGTRVCVSLPIGFSETNGVSGNLALTE
jgi:signal transduction histidine kinase